MPAHRYHADPAETPSLTASIADRLVNQTPLHAWAAHPRLNPDFEREEKAAFDVGSLVHALVLEGDNSKVHVVYADDWRTKDARTERDEARDLGRIPILQKDWKRIETMVGTIRAQLVERADEPPLFTDGKPEQTLVWRERDVTCRARLDWLRDDFLAIDDLKTTGASANPLRWGRRTLFDIGADIQVAFYLRGLKAVTGVDATFRYVLAETKQPYALAVVSLASSALELGRAKVDRALQLWRECTKTGVWPGYPTGIYYAETPAFEEMRWLEHDGERMAA